MRLLFYRTSTQMLIYRLIIILLITLIVIKLKLHDFAIWDVDDIVNVVGRYCVEQKCELKSA